MNSRMNWKPLARQIYYHAKPLIPRSVQLFARSAVIRAQLKKYAAIWPINPAAGQTPSNWPGWPEGKRFALVLTHDVDTQGGHDKCRRLMQLEEARGLRSEFTLVPELYKVSPDLRQEIVARGFELGVHGLNHDGKLFSSRELFMTRARRINEYLKDWGAVGFRAPAMHHNLDWIHDLDIEYDMSTFDVDPFEPQPDGMNTIFPFWVDGSAKGRKGYVELPYTLPQDFTPFILLRHKDIGYWKKKLDWIVEKGGMALLNSHPDYMGFDPKQLAREEYPVSFYTQWLDYVLTQYAGQYWNALPRDVAHFFKTNVKGLPQKNGPLSDDMQEERECSIA
jgi:peptidoglycan/xylan/chitin deacetylase (PgdA/CDA1 family)